MSFRLVAISLYFVITDLLFQLVLLHLHLSCVYLVFNKSLHPKRCTLYIDYFLFKCNCKVYWLFKRLFLVNSLSLVCTTNSKIRSFKNWLVCSNFVGIHFHLGKCSRAHTRLCDLVCDFVNVLLKEIMIPSRDHFVFEIHFYPDVRAHRKFKSNIAGTGTETKPKPMKIWTSWLRAFIGNCCFFHSHFLRYSLNSLFLFLYNTHPMHFNMALKACNTYCACQRCIKYTVSFSMSHTTTIKPTINANHWSAVL